MKVVWTATAVARLEEIEDYIAVDDAEAAERFVAQLIDAGDNLATTPMRGRVVRDLPSSGLREIIFRRYRIVYRLRGNQLQILTVFEGHRLLRERELDE